VARSELPTAPPPTAKRSTVRHRVPFFETDAMGIVHHANSGLSQRWPTDHV